MAEQNAQKKNPGRAEGKSLDLEFSKPQSRCDDDCNEQDGVGNAGAEKKLFHYFRFCAVVPAAKVGIFFHISAIIFLSGFFSSSMYETTMAVIILCLEQNNIVLQDNLYIFTPSREGVCFVCPKT